MRILITGGAGFIGVHLARRFLREGCEVSIIDNFSPQVHGTVSQLPADLCSRVTLQIANVNDREVLHRALTGQDVLVHLAAETGTGQSMYEVSRYEQVNIGGTANLIETLMNDSSRTITRIVVASSRAVYGEGKYNCNRDGAVFPVGRKLEDLRSGKFEPACPLCGGFCDPLPTDENAPLRPVSFYGLTKQVQEEMVLMFAKQMRLSAFALRYQNVYGPGQSLQNPYTGILAIFAGQARANQPIHVFEDGRESRDFVYIEDVVEATWRCISAQGLAVEVLNVGSGRRTSVFEVAQQIVSISNSKSSVEINGSFREGDIRHNVADITKAKSLIGFEPQWGFREGLEEFLRWTRAQDMNVSKYELSLLESRDRGILHV